MSEMKILTLDIETRPAKAYVWKLFDQNISLDALIEPGRTICVGAKWLGEKTTYLFAEWHTGGHDEMLHNVHKMMSEADGVVTFNGDKFDIPKLRGEFVHAGLEPLPPLTSIDVYKTVRKLGFQSGKLAFVGPFLGLGAKVKNEGFPLWTGVMNGDEKAQKRMENYCVGDVTLTEKLYLKLRPYIMNHPHMGLTSHQCGACGSDSTQSRGYRRTKVFKIQRIHCQNCGAWQDGSRTKV